MSLPLSHFWPQIIPGYELKVEVKWEGSSPAGTASGLLELPYLADENAGEPDEVEVRVTATGDSAADRACKAAAQKQGLVRVRAAVAVWVAEMARGGPGGEGPGRPEGSGDGGGEAAAPAPLPEVTKPKPPPPPPDEATATIRLTERFFCRPADIFEALTSTARMRAFTQADASVSAEEGAEFVMFGGAVHGRNVAVSPTRLEQAWRFRNWAEGVHSTVVISLQEPEHGTTVLTLVQTGVPRCDAFGNETVVETTETGWKQNVFGARPALHSSTVVSRAMQGASARCLALAREE